MPERQTVLFWVWPEIGTRSEKDSRRKVGASARPKGAGGRAQNRRKRDSRAPKQSRFLRKQKRRGSAKRGRPPPRPPQEISKEPTKNCQPSSQNYIMGIFFSSPWGAAFSRRAVGVQSACRRSVCRPSAARCRRAVGVQRAKNVKKLTFRLSLVAIYIYNVYLCGALVNIYTHNLNPSDHVSS